MTRPQTQKVTDETLTRLSQVDRGGRHDVDLEEGVVLPPQDLFEGLRLGQRLPHVARLMKRRLGQ